MTSCSRYVAFIKLPSSCRFYVDYESKWLGGLEFFLDVGNLMVCTILEGDTILMDSILDEIYDRFCS